MAGIVINSNFDLNASTSLDSRLVATSSVSRSNITWKYEGMKVYQSDDKKTYLWNGATWSQETGGIYGGSGSLVGDTYVDTGVVGPTLSNKSNILFLSSTSGTDNILFSSQFNRHTTTGSPDWTTVEVTNQFRWKTSSGPWKDGPYVSYNPSDPTVGGDIGGLAFGTGDGSGVVATERMRITSSGNVGIGTKTPNQLLVVGTDMGTITTDNAILIGKISGNSSIILAASNTSFGLSRWDASTSKMYFQTRNGSTSTLISNQLVLDNGTGNVGVGTNTPSYKLDVNGSIRSTTNITSVNTISDKFMFSGVGGAQFSVSSSVISASASGYNFLVNKVSKIVVGATNTSISTNASVGLSMSVTGNIISTSGSITNYESATNLSSTLTYLYYSLDGAFGVLTDSLSSGGFIYTAKAYRVGALVHLFIEITRGIPVQYGGGVGSFYGWAIRLGGQRFRPVNTTSGVGFGGWNGNTVYGPVEMKIFTSDGGLSASTGDFYVQFIPYVEPGGSNGSGYRAGVRDNIRFRGSITYVAGV
jgi:hypothetical protein